MTSQQASDCTLMAAGKGAYTLYPAFRTPEEEYQYISSRMAELERQLGHQSKTAATHSAMSAQGETTVEQQAPKKEKKKRKKVSTKKKKLTDESGTAAESDAHKAARKKKVGKKVSKKKSSKSASAIVMKEGEVSVHSVETVAVCIGKEVESEMMNVETKTAEAEAAPARSQPRLRKAASFLFNKTSDVTAYLRKVSADIREMASQNHRDQGPTEEILAKTANQTKPEAAPKRTKLFQKRRKSRSRRRSAQDAQECSEDDLNYMSSAASEVEDDLSYDPRYTDAVFVLPTSRNHRHASGQVSDYETFSIMIEEDSTTYDSPNMLPAALPEVEIDIELDEEERSDTDSSSILVRRREAPRRLPPPSQPILPATLAFTVNPPTMTLASKTSYRMSMPPVPPSAATPPHPASFRNMYPLPPVRQQPVNYLPYRSGWGAQQVTSMNERTYSSSSGTIPTAARRRGN